MAANIGDNITHYVPKPIWEDIFSRLSPIDARAAALSCRLFAAIYRDLHPLQTESRREALAGLQKEIIVYSTQEAKTVPIQNLPTFMIEYDGSNTFELFHVNEPNEVKMKFVLPSEQPIDHFIARLCLNNRKLVIGYNCHSQIGIAIFNWKDQKCEKDHHFPMQSVKDTVMRFHDDTLMFLTSSDLYSSKPDGTVLITPLPKKVLHLLRHEDYFSTFSLFNAVNFHPRKPYLLFQSPNIEKKYDFVWNFKTGRKTSLIHPSEVQKKGFFSVAGCGFFESNVFLSWSKYAFPALTYEAYYDLSKMDSKDELISSRKFTLRNKASRGVAVVSEKYLVRMEVMGELECDTIRDRIRLWRIKVEYPSWRVLNFPIDDPHVIFDNIFLNVATGEKKSIDGNGKLICLVHSDKGPCFFFLQKSWSGLGNRDQ